MEDGGYPSYPHRRGFEIYDLVTQSASAGITSSTDLWVRGLALDLAGDKIYWTQTETGSVHRANLDGSSVEDVLPVLTAAWYVQLYLCTE